ncbi:hypothetical protein [Haladaptatus caseinilyticus]|uniref:hypothetical protein n=1 Tax=Haladaptatus caseinilyticus TaxID=2993314 RepID=UPI00224AB04B|nr:hypothetical protein [Haladaptatus caseinilyticus]
MNPRVKASLLWGVIGVLVFLVLLQGYELYSGYRYDIGLKVGATAFVAVGTSVLTYTADGFLD